ncbi:trypsin-like peptidase domain-containing protein [Streptomyces sp. ISL-11]|uniref:VMAP-C domain-containing protein n=1 Tax=Streptomyces sp. ISL-11 TaxID=2819174 RepID=UPI001BE79200|nr:trypsin-like peptidase domain-containing protein [Streptomyces sp. ISL-11]MBT2387127.1 trypsin-like peptidase domain-containing protein [Streptomyces sp. ISL-11]
MSALEGTVRRAVVRISAPGGGYDPSGDRFWGSGFFIAPGWVLTCAHVVGNGGGGVLGGETAIDVTDWREHTAPGRVALVLPAPGDPGRPPRRWGLPDLALVEVPGAEDVECLWLSDRSAVVPARISLHGWSRETGELALRFGMGLATGSDGSDGSAMLLRGEIPVAGSSGGPVVDVARGAVIGVCKGRGQDTAGLAVPVTALRRVANDRPGRDRLHSLVTAHDLHHLRRYRTVGTGGSWTGVQHALRPPGAGAFSPVLRTHLFARLAELTQPATPGEVMALVDAVKRRMIQDPYQPGTEHDPRTWREGVGLLYDLRDGDGRAPERDLELEAVLLYAARVAAAVSLLGRPEDEKPLRELSGWLTGREEPIQPVIREEIAQILHGGADRPDGPRALTPPGTVELRKPARRKVEPAVPAVRARADVLVEIDPLLYGDSYPWRVKLLREDDLVTLRGDDRGVPRARLRETLLEPIAEAVRQGDVGEHLAAVEVVLPRELFDEPLDSWRLSPPCTAEDGTPLLDPDTLPLGQRRVVVLRDRWRRDHPAIPEWRRRWNGTSRGPLSAVPLRREAPERGHDGPGRESGHLAYGRLSDADDAAVPVYCGPVASGPGATAMEAALAAGHAVVIWRRCATGHADCADFHRHVSHLVSQAGTAAGLHRRIRNLRIRCDDPGHPDPDALWARSIALLFDSPDHPPLPDAALHAPGVRP